MSPSLSWNEQVETITNKVTSLLQSLRFHRKSLSEDLWKYLIESLINPHLDYCSVVFNSLDKTCTRKLQVAQNFCVIFVQGFILFIRSTNISTQVTQHRLSLGWISIGSRQNLSPAKIMYKGVTLNSLNHLTPHMTIALPSTTSHRSKRNPPTAFALQPTHYEFWKRSFAYLSQDVLNELSVTEFKINRLSELHKWLYNLFLKLETEG